MDYKVQTFSSVCSFAAIKISLIINYHNQIEKKATEKKIGELMLNHSLMKNLNLFLYSQADVMGFFFF